MGFVLRGTFHLLYKHSAESACTRHRLTVWCHLCVFVADYCLHVLRHHAKQVGPADLSAWLHEEPPGLPPRPPCTSVAFLQLHVHARRVSSWLLQYWFRENSGYLQLMAHDAGSFNLTFIVCSVLSLEQLGFNALLQLMIGVPLEMVHGILRISLLYMAGVLAGEFFIKCFIVSKARSIIQVSYMVSYTNCLRSHIGWTIHYRRSTFLPFTQFSWFISFILNV